MCISLELRSGKEVYRFIVLKKYFIAMAELTEAQIQMITCRYFIYAFGESGQKYREKTTFRVRLKPADWKSIEAFQKVIRYVNKYFIHFLCTCFSYVFAFKDAVHIYFV